MCMNEDEDFIQSMKTEEDRRYMIAVVLDIVSDVAPEELPRVMNRIREVTKLRDGCRNVISQRATKKEPVHEWKQLKEYVDIIKENDSELLRIISLNTIDNLSVGFIP